MTNLPLVLDTNIVLDLFVFADERARALRDRLEDGSADWFATAAMRDELERVLDYGQIASRLAYYELTAQGVMARFDEHVRIVDVPDKAPITCSDPDDQKFIDLAVARKCLLLSKDAAVLAMGKRLVALEAAAASAIDA